MTIARQDHLKHSVSTTASESFCIIANLLPFFYFLTSKRQIDRFVSWLVLSSSTLWTKYCQIRIQIFVRYFVQFLGRVRHIYKTVCLQIIFCCDFRLKLKVDLFNLYLQFVVPPAVWPQSCFDWQLKLGPVEFCQLSLLQKSEWEALLQFRLPGLTLHFNILQ